MSEFEYVFLYTMDFVKNLTVKKYHEFDEKNYLWSFKLAELGKQGVVIWDYNYDDYKSFENLKENVKYSLSDFHFKIVKIYEDTTVPSVDYADQSYDLECLEGEYNEFYNEHPIIWMEFDIIGKTGKTLNYVAEYIYEQANGIFGTIYNKNTGKVICKINNIGEWLSLIGWVDINAFTDYIQHDDIKLMDDGEISCWPQSDDDEDIHLRQYSTVLYRTYNELEQIISVAVGQNKHLSNINKIDWTTKFIDQYIKKYNFPFVLVGMIAEYVPMDPPYW